MFLLLGLLLCVAALPVSHKEGTDLSEAAEDGEKTVLEQKLERVLSGVEDIGEVRAMVMTEEKKDAGGFYSSESVKVSGVLIAAQGADEPVVVREIQEAVQALFQVEPHKIKVMKRK